MYDSRRGYFEQLAYYKDHQSKEWIPPWKRGPKQYSDVQRKPVLHPNKSRAGEASGTAKPTEADVL